MVSSLDYTSPNIQFSFDVNRNRYFTKDQNNFINSLGIDQLNTLQNTSLLDIYLSANNIIEPHIHQNAAELVFCISGSAVISLLNPFTKEILNFPVIPGQVANIPQGWWHYEIATADSTHLLAIFNASTPEVIFASDMLRLTPSAIMSHSYCLNPSQWQQAIAPITNTTIIGPPAACTQRAEEAYESSANQWPVPSDACRFDPPYTAASDPWQ